MLDEAARPHGLSRSGYGVLGIVARTFESALEDLLQVDQWFLNFGLNVCLFCRVVSLIMIRELSRDAQQRSQEGKP